MKFCRVDVLQGLHILIIATYSLPGLYLPKIKNALFGAPECNDLIVLVLCNVHISSHPLNKQEVQITLLEGENSDFIFWMERAWSPLCCHGNVTVGISWNFVVSTSTIHSFNSIQKKSSYIFHFLWFYIILCPRGVKTNLICINQNLEKHGNQNCSSSLWKLFQMG